MSFDDAVAHLDALGVDAMKSMAPSRHRIEAICAALNHPERQVQSVHITGTNGKTSTARITASLLTATGISVGTYTSPHLQTVRERITLNGQPISEDVFGDVFDHLLPYIELVEKELGERLTYFEILTAMYFAWAAESVDASVVEVGLGGRWDATNVIQAPVAVITNVGLDHTGMLGTDRVTIATEKAGIIKPGSRVVTGERYPSVLEVILDEARAGESVVAVLGQDFDLSDNRVAFGGRYLSVATSARAHGGLFLPLHGAHQGVNAAIALEAVTRFLPVEKVDDEVVAEGLAAVSVPGRLESVPTEEGAARLLLDVAHNPDGMSALVTGLLETFAFERCVFVLGVLADKDYRGMLTEMSRIECSIIVTEAKAVRAAPPSSVAAAADELGLEVRVIEDIEAAVKSAVASAEQSDLVCITGSHYLVGDARTLLVGPATV